MQQLIAFHVHPNKYFLYCRAVSSLSSYRRVPWSAILVRSSSFRSISLYPKSERNKHGNLATHCCVYSNKYIHLMLQSWVLSLQLSVGKKANLLTIPVTAVHTKQMIQCLIHNIIMPMDSNKYLLYCRAESSLSCCRLVSWQRRLGVIHPLPPSWGLGVWASLLFMK